MAGWATAARRAKKMMRSTRAAAPTKPPMVAPTMRPTLESLADAVVVPELGVFPPAPPLVVVVVVIVVDDVVSPADVHHTRISAAAKSTLFGESPALEHFTKTAKPNSELSSGKVSNFSLLGAGIPQVSEAALASGVFTSRLDGAEIEESKLCILLLLSVLLFKNVPSGMTTCNESAGTSNLTIEETAAVAVTNRNLISIPLRVVLKPGKTPSILVKFLKMSQAVFSFIVSAPLAADVLVSPGNAPPNGVGTTQFCWLPPGIPGKQPATPPLQLNAVAEAATYRFCAMAEITKLITRTRGSLMMKEWNKKSAQKKQKLFGISSLRLRDYKVRETRSNPLYVRMNKLKIFRPKNFQQTHCSNPYAPHPRYTSPGIVVNVAIGFDRPERRTSEISCFLCLESFNEVHNESFSDVKTFSMPSSIHHRKANGNKL